MGAPPALGAHGQDVVVGVVPAQLLFRLRPPFFYPRHIPGTVATRRRSPGREVESYHRVQLAVQPGPLVCPDFDGQLGYLSVAGLPDLVGIQLVHNGVDALQPLRLGYPGNGVVAGILAHADEIG